MVALTLVLASTLTAGLATYGDGLDDRQPEFEEALGPQTVSTNPWEGEQGDLLRPADDEAGATGVAYRLNYTIKNSSDVTGDNLGSVEVRVRDGSPDMFSGVGNDSLERMVVDNGSDGTVDVVLTDNVTQTEPDNGGTDLTFDLETDYQPETDDSVVAVFEDVDNPVSAGEYEVEAKPGDAEDWTNATIVIE